MEGSGSVVFPHCACDSRKDGRVIPVVTFEGFRLQACREDGTKEVNEGRAGGGGDPETRIP